MKKRNSLIDFLKIFLIILVVGQHYPTLIPREMFLPFARIAVPLFFLISGYFVACSDKPDIERAKKNIISTLKYVLIAIIAFCIHDVIYAIIYGKDIMAIINGFFYDNFIREFLFYNQPYSYIIDHLWFIIALFVTALIHYVFCKTNKTKWYPYIAVVLLICALCLGQYSKVLGLGDISKILTRNAIFRGFPLFALGFFFGKKNFKLKPALKWSLLAVGVVFACLAPVENMLLNADGIGKGGLYITTVLGAIPIFLFVVNTPVTVNTAWMSPHLVFNIYIFHKMIGRYLVKFNFMPAGFETLIIFAITFAVCELAYLTILFIKHIIKKHKENKTASATEV